MEHKIDFLKRLFGSSTKQAGGGVAEESKRDLEAMDKRKKIEAEGTIERIVDKQISYPSLASGVKSRDVEGVSLTLKDGENIHEVDFPKRFSQPEQAFMLGNRAQYKMVHTSVYEGDSGFLRGYDYKLKIVDGSQKGLELVEKITI